MSLYKIAFVTGSRADYGIVRKYLELMNRDSEIILQIIATGALLSEKYAHQVDLIYKDGFTVAGQISYPIDCSSDGAVVYAMSVALDKFGAFFTENRYDLLIILGDRYEMLSVAIAAAMQRIPILHLHGGEATYGNYDEFIRHAITKMSLFHFTATEEYRNRVIQLGESPERVFYLGALGAENCLYIDKSNVPCEVSELPHKKYFVVLYHPETLTNGSTLQQIEELLRAISCFNNYKFVFLGTNADTNADIIRSKIKVFVEENKNTLYYENLHTDAYHYLVKNSVCLIGNSSSGIIEAPSLGVYTINIGDRQKGRVRGKSVIDVKCEYDDIFTAIKKVIEINGTATDINPYYKENSVCLYYEKTKEILGSLDKWICEPKVFFDIF